MHWKLFLFFFLLGVVIVNSFHIYIFFNGDNANAYMTWI